MSISRIPDDWQPPPCKHGVRAEVDWEFIEYMGSGPFVERVPIRKTLWYDCPTPSECVQEAYDSAPRQQEKLP